MPTRPGIVCPTLHVERLYDDRAPDEIGPASAPDRMINVALLSNSAQTNTGWGRFTVDLCQALLERDGVSIRLLLPKGAPPPEDNALARVSEHTLPSQRASFRRAPWTLRDYVLRPPSLDGTDIVHAIVEYPYALVADAAARRAQIPSIVSAQGTYGVVPLTRQPDRWLYSRALRRAAAVTVPSRYTREAMRSALGAPIHIDLLPNAVNGERFSGARSSDVRTRFGLPAASPLVLSVGRLKPRKGFDALVRAFAILHADVPEAHLAVVGDGDVALLQRQAAELGLREVVHVLGGVTEADLVALFQTCDLFALLPRIDQGHFEGFGLVFLEANACSKPVVGTRSGDVPDAIVDGETGFLVDEDDAAGAAAAMRRALDDPVLAAKLGEGARKWAAEHSWSGYADRLVSLYERALERAR